MIIFGLIGNIIVIYVTNKQKRKSVVDQYVKNLAIAGKKYEHFAFFDILPTIYTDWNDPYNIIFMSILSITVSWYLIVFDKR